MTWLDFLTILGVGVVLGAGYIIAEHLWMQRRMRENMRRFERMVQLFQERWPDPKDPDKKEEDKR